jgi:hypothetical protein
LESGERGLAPSIFSNEAERLGATAKAEPAPLLWRRKILLSGVIVILAVLTLRGITRGEFNVNVDESYHAFTGCYFADLIRSHPFTHPLRYTYEYYAHYPAIAVGHWPPLFYVVEGLAFILFGASVAVARLVVLGFALLGAVSWFFMVERFENDIIAAASTLVLIALPFILLYEKSVMLEIPTLALAIPSIYYWLVYLRDEKPAHLYVFAVLSGLALLTKENAIFIAPFCLLTLAASRNWRLLGQRSLYLALGIVLLIAAPFYVFMLIVHGSFVSDALKTSTIIIHHPWLYYAQALPGQLGWPLLIFALAGMCTSPWWGKRQNIVPMMMWILSCYLTFTLIGDKDPRFTIYLIPPLIYFAVCPLVSTPLSGRLRVPSAAVLGLVVVFTLGQGWRYQRPYVTGYQAAARRLMEAKHPGVVLYDGNLAANFIFFMRRFDPDMHAYLMRKALYVTLVDRHFSSEELARNRSDIETILNNYGVKYIVVEQNVPLHFPVQRTLRRLLLSPQFDRIGEFPIETNLAYLKNAKLEIYRNRQAAPPLKKQYRIKMLTTGHDIVVPLSNAGAM